MTSLGTADHHGENRMLHIDLPTRAEIERLVAHRGAPAVSIYLATTPVTQDTATDRIELKNLLKQAVAQMEAGGVEKRAIWPIEEAVAEMIDDDAFWLEQAHSLAVFVSPEASLTFRLPNKLPSHVEVSDRFHIKPLLRAVTFPQTAWVLAIGKGAVRLIEVSADLPPDPVPVPDLPRSMADALGRRSHGERGMMRGEEAMSESALLNRYARTVDRALRPMLAGHERPLIVAATEPLASVFRKVSSYPATAAETIPGSADDTPDHMLAAAARGVLDRIYAADLDGLAKLYVTREAQGRATGDVAQAARAATFGAIDTLIVDMEATVPGTVADEDGAVSFTEAEGAGSYGVVDEIARRALASGGRVVAARRADIPRGGVLAAILRYPV